MPYISKALEGKKTYVCFFAVIVVGALYAFDVIDQQKFEALSITFGSLAGISLRASLKK